MGTKAAAFTAKIHNLQHYNARIKHNLVPLPSGDDVANTLKYFSQTLLSVLKDVPSISLDMLRSPEKDAIRTSLFPSLDYKTLHNALVELVDAVPLVQHGAHALGYTILHTLACLVPFLEHELMDTLPYLVASTMTLFPCSLHKDIIDVLCNHLLPFTFREDTNENNDSYASMSTAAVLMMIFQYTDCSAYHCQVLECLMALKKDIVKDLLCVIAHGTANARWHAAELLFQYLPSLNPALLDRKGIGNKPNGWLLDSLCTLTCLVLFPTFSPSSVSPSLMPQGSGHTGWKAQLCQRENCTSMTGNEAVKMCFEHSVAIASGEHPPPLYMCEACAEEVEKEHGSANLVDVLLPMKEISVKCEDPDCKGSDKSAVATCFSMECAKRNGHRPIRYCADCVLNYHNETRGGNHMLHNTIPSPWSMDLETQSYMVEAVISLLREAEPLNERHVQESMNGQDDREDSREISVVEERQLLSRYGIWLLVGLCAPDENTPDESLGRLLSMLFQWFVYTACLPDDKAGNALEKLKKEYIQGWLLDVKKKRFEVYVSCLLPHPVDYAKVGGHWESWPCYPVQIREGFKRLLCLIPYDIITEDVWEYIMPYWMDSLRHEAIEAEFSELKLLLSRVFDPCLRFLDFDTKEVYKFLSVRFDCASSPVQEQALYWLQILSMLEIPVPLELLYEMFKSGVANLASRDGKTATAPSSLLIPHPSQEQKSPNGPTTSRSQKFPMNLVNVPEEENPLLVVEYESDAEIDLPCYILMLDILIKQLELQDVPLHKGLEQKDAQIILLLIRDQIEAPWEGTHTCNEPNEGSQCIFCEMCAIFFQLSLSLIEYFSPVMELTMADVPGDTPVSEAKHSSNLDIDALEKSELDVKIECEVPTTTPHKEDATPIPIAVNVEAVESGDKATGHISPIQTATVQECSEMDTVSIIPTEKVVTAVATEVTLTEDDVAGAKCTIETPLLIDENEQPTSQITEEQFWPTTEGKYKFSIEELPPQLQLFYVLLKDLLVFEDADVLYHILSCLKVMCLHSEVLNKAAHSHRGFLIWCQESSLIVNLWKLLQMEFSHIAQLATSLLLHAITLPSGSDMFWKTLEQDFHNKEWRNRFSAVERVTVIAHFVDPSTVKNSPLLQSALACAFCYLVHSLDDENPTASQRTLLNLESIKTPSLKLFVWCLGIQFDCNITDRPMILQTIFQIHNHLTNKRFLTWDFFLNRFDTLFLEDQIILERLGEISYVRDLKNTNVNSEMFLTKLKRAQDALAHTSKSKSLTSSFGDKIPYKRIVTALSPMAFRQDRMEKFYERQSSAPVLKRKSSRLVGSTVGAIGPLQHFPNSFFTDGHLKESMQEEAHFLNVLYKSMDIEDHDKETLHLVIFLLMQFLSRPDPIHRFDEKNITRSQTIVLRHLNIMLGYSQHQGEGRFLLPPHKIRSSAIFSTFLLCMPKVLDYNFAMGNFLLTMCLSVLVCCPSPHKYPSEHFPPNYSIWLLSNYCRHSWLQSTLVIMYKYHYDSFPYNRYIKWLVLIILNTLKSQRHRCKLVHEQLPSPLPSRSRDFSTPSADMMEHMAEKDKDASFDTSSLHEDGSKSKVKTKFSDKSDETAFDQKQIAKDKGHQWKSWKSSERSCSSDGEDVEPELEAIPESPKSENSETEQFPLPCYPQTVEQACAKIVREPYSAKESVIVSDPWSKVSEATLVSNSDNLNMNITELKDQNAADMPHSSVSSDAENVSIIEKSSYEVMEKNIDLESKSGSKDFKEKKLVESKDIKIESPKLKSEDSPKIKKLHDSPKLKKLQDSPTFRKSLDSPKHKKSLDSPLFKKSLDSPILKKTQDSPILKKAQDSPILKKAQDSPILKKAQDSPKHKKSQDSPKHKKSHDSPKLKKMFAQCSFAEVDPFTHNRAGFNANIQMGKPSPPKTEIQPHFTKKDTEIDFNKLATAAVKKSESKDVSRMKSLPFEGNKHQSVCRSKTDSNILDLPQSEDIKMTHSRYPHSKAFQSKKNLAKSSRKAEMLSSENLTVPIFRPPLERLLPIGLPDREKPKRTDTLTHTEPEPYHPPLRIDHSLSRDTFTSRDLCEDKGVQTGNVDILFDIPAPERLLPVGPLPTKKDSYPLYSRSDSEFKKPEFIKSPSELKPISPDPKVASATKIIEPQKSVELKSIDKQESEVKDVPAGKSETVPLELKSPKPTEKTESNDKKCLEQIDSFSFATMGLECIANTIFDFTSDITPSLPGIFEVCKTAMDIRKEDDQDKKSDDHADRDHRNSGSSVDGLQNERIELSTFSDNIQKGLEKAFEDDTKCRLPYRQRKQRKSGFVALEAQRSFDYQTAGGRRMRKVEMGSISASLASKRASTCQSFARSGEDMVIERCTECGAVVEEYNDEEIGLCIVILSTFVHREPAMAAPLLPKMLRVVARIASTPNYPWQNESSVHLPGGSVSVARQFLRCTLHQLAPNGVFVQIFQSHIIEPEFYKTMASSLADFAELNQVSPLLLLFENLNDRKHLHHEVIFHILDNVATYLDCLPLESALPPWPTFLQQLDLFLRKLLLTLTPGPIQLNSVLQIILCALKLPVIKEAKSILDPFSKVLSHAIQHSSLNYNQLSELCTVCNRNARDRDKQLLTRTAVFELIQALKFKTSIPDSNLLTLVQFILADCGGRLAPNVILDGMPYTFDSQSVYKTFAGECMQTYLNDALEFVSDVHTLTKVKNMLYGNYTHLNEETLGGHLKAGISQFLAIEFSKNNGRDNRAISRYLPWLYHPPTTLQQGPKEFIDCVSHIRLLSWLLLGALIHSALMQTPSTCQPIPLEANCHIAEHIQVILTGFSEQSKVSVLHMSSLFHAFILCQLWTMYCEHMVSLNPPGSDQNQACGLTLTDFWAKVTPGILQLVCHSKVEEYPQLAEMVSLHFLSLMEALQECNSTVLARLLPMWTQVLYSFQGYLSGNLYMRLHTCVSCRPPSRTREETASISTTFLRWLQRLQFKMGQIEMQSSTATQFYSL